ncbi:hypothetical protein BDQ17DRAFT_1384997 [Cyathus striatus]|nr:hypothetical protein BDQ17DRAFT_1384997 [Cyathus striatus]
MLASCIPHCQKWSRIEEICIRRKRSSHTNSEHAFTGGAKPSHGITQNRLDLPPSSSSHLQNKPKQPLHQNHSHIHHFPSASSSELGLHQDARFLTRLAHVITLWTW